MGDLIYDTLYLKANIEASDAYLENSNIHLEKTINISLDKNIKNDTDTVSPKLKQDIATYNLKRSITNNTMRIDEITKHLNDCHSQYQIGTYFSAIGYLAIACSFLVQSDHSSQLIVLAIGGVCLTTGGILWVDSHRYLNLQ